MITLALETSGRRGGVAVQRDDGPLIERLLSGDRRQSPDLLRMVQQALAEIGAELRQVGQLAWSRGPGSFTGLRIGATMVRMIAEVTGCRVVGVSSLEAAARNVMALPHTAGGPRRAIVIVDAKREQVYGAAYQVGEAGQATAVVEPGLVPPAELFSKVPRPFWILGEGVEKHRTVCEQSGGSLAPEAWLAPRPAAVLELGRLALATGGGDGLAAVLPEYIRPPECEEYYEIRRAEAIRKRLERESAS
jgi:tRNA threonylcarbamoyladenosine biosynthesis protein TsaB